MKHYDSFCRSLENLRKSAEGTANVSIPKEVADTVQAGLVWQFLLCFEQSWKLMKEVLEGQGLLIKREGSPRAVIKHASEVGMIDDEDGWLHLLRTWNTLVHTYSGDESLDATRSIQGQYLPILGALKAELEENWLQ